MEVPALFVPIHLKALVIGGGEDANSFKNLGLDLSLLNEPGSYQNLGSMLEVSPTAGVNKFYKVGIFLHWVLPSAYRKGQSDENRDEIKFPLVPNRWLVVRTNEANVPEINAWIVESDTVRTTGPYNWVKKPETSGQPYSAMRIGKVTQLVKTNTWVEPNPQRLFLTIMPPGNPDFAASYMHSKEVFGFYDAMTGVNVDHGKKFSYRVFGWMSDPRADPLAGLTTKEAFLAKLQENNWGLTDAAIAALTATNVPQATVCHGMVHTVTYSKTPKSTIPSRTNVQLAIGNSTAEAMAALLKPTQEAGSATMGKKLLAAYQFDLLKKNGLPKAADGKGLNALDAPLKDMHARAFHPSDGGTLWVIQKQQNASTEGDAQTRVVETYLPFSTLVSQRLLDLNALQDRLNRKVDELASYQEQLNALAYKMGYQWSRLFEPQERLEPILRPGGSLEKAIATCKGHCLRCKQELTALEASLIPARSQLVAAMLSDANLKNHELKEVPMEKYHAPSEPSLVINGLNPSAVYASGNQVLCRLATELAQEVRIPWGNNPYRIPANELYLDNLVTGAKNSIFPVTLSTLPKAIQAILNESLLLDPLCASAVAAHLGNSFGRSILTDDIKYPTLIANAFAAVTKVPPVAQESFLVNLTTKAVLPEAFAAAAWTQPWIPLYLEWKVTWEGKKIPSTPADFWKDWKLGEQGAMTDFEWKGTINGGAKEFSGRTFLSTEFVNKTKSLNQMLSAFSKSPGMSIFENFAPLAQDLSGWTAQLIHRLPAIQLPYIVPIEDELEAKDKNALKALYDGINALIGDLPRWVPLLEGYKNLVDPPDQHFHPLRGGLLKLTSLRVVDAFGQVLTVLDEPRKLTPSEVKKALPLRSPSADNSKYYLPPRIVQPARLRWEWLSARHPGRVTDSDPGTSPVCGWLLHNKLDKAIVLYGADGSELGALELMGDGVRLQPPFGKAAMNIQHPILAGFVNAFVPTSNLTPQNCKDRLLSLMRQMDATDAKLHAKVSRQNLEMSLPIGSPIAIVTAQCTLELKDLPASRQGWLADPQADPQRDPMWTVPFKACIGNAASNLDGMVGFFRDGKYDALQLPYGQDGRGNSYLSTQSPVNLSLSQPKAFVFLLDPRMGIEVTTGILPALHVELPVHTIQTSLKAINLRFLAAPLIMKTPTDRTAATLNLGFSLKDIHGMEWVWLQNESGDVSLEKKVESSPQDRLSFSPLQALEGFFKLKNK